MSTWLTSARECGTIRAPAAHRKIEMITPNEFYVKLGDSIRRRREESRLTQAELGESLGLSRTSVTNIERGRQRLLIDQFQRVCNVLGVSTDTLLAGLDAEERPVVRQPSELKQMPTVTAYLQRTLVKAGER
jgi:transcriptional regulator with XRE-family HTH domain